uniref:Titin n=1 Tax=Pygocentrus nattereri TaxID=42514 RepID=A0AAR2KZV0_PYGNA
MVLTWERPEDDGGSQIESYVLEKRDKEGVRWTKCNRKRLTDLRFRATGLTEGHSYEFRVSAENAAGVGTPSGPSEYYKACDATYPPGPPSNPKVTDHSSTTVSLAWTRPIYDGGASVSGYIVEMKEASDDEWIVCTPPTGVQTTHFTVKKLKENAEYNFRICAVNIEGAGDHVDVQGSVIAAEKLEAPEVELDADLRKIVTVRASATLRLFVTIRGSPEPEVKWTKAESPLTERAQIEVTSSYTMLVIDNVDRFDTGKYVVTLENNSGTKSAFVNVRVLDSPSAPVNFVVKDIKRDSVQLQWEPPHIDGGAKITHYIVEKRESKRMAFTTVTNNCVRNSFRVDDLQEGGVYHFRVLAVNELGVGLPATTTEPIKVSQAPLPPGKVTLVDVTRHSASLSWEKPDHDGGSKITGYIVEMLTKGSEKWTVCATVKALEATIEGLTTGEEYSFRIIAINDKGKSDPKPLVAPVVAKDITIEPIINLLFSTYSVKAGDDLKIDVPFRGRPHPEVSWKKDGHSLKQTTRVNVLTSTTSSKIIIKDATRDDAGKYEITLTNPIGVKSAEVTVIVLDKPGPPSAIRVDEVSADYISLSWDPPVYDGGCQINNYVVEKRDTTTTTWQIVSATVARTSIKVSRLTQGTEYQFRIAAENRYGKSHAVDSAPIVAQYPFTPPGPPADLQVAHATKSGMLVTWKRPASDGGSPVIGYHLECKEQSSILWTKVTRGLVADTQFKVTGLEEGILYQYRVYAENIAGIGPCTKASEPVAARDPCDPPGQPVVVNITRTSVSLSWTKPENDGGAKVTGYIVERKELPDGRWLKCNFTNLQETYFDVTGLTEDQRYDFHVIAKNAAGLLSEPSEGTGPVTVKDDVDPPRITIEDKLRQLVVVKAGDILRIDAEISGRPIPVISWSKDGKEIEAKARVEISSTLMSTTLIVRDSIRRDSGQYVLTLQNVAGTRSLAVNCKVLDRPVTKLLKGNEYIFRVRGVNKYGTGEALESDAVKAMDPFTVPAAPTNVEVTSVTSEAMTICWERPVSDGGSSISGYVIEKREKSGLRWVRVNKRPVYDLRVKASNLREGCEYEYRVYAENAAGLSAPSVPCPLTKAEDPLFLPSPPAKPKIIDSTKTTITLAWNKPLKTLIVKDGSSFTLRVPFKGKPVPHVMWNKPDVDLRVRAAIDTTDTCTSITVEQLGVTDVTKDSVALAWTKPEHDGGSRITNYQVDALEKGQQKWIKCGVTKTTHFVVYGLRENAEYFFRVRAENHAGFSDPKDMVMPVLVKDQLGKLYIIRLVSSICFITLE